MAQKKPDLVVWDETKGYYAKELTYGSNQGAPAIKVDDVIGWRAREVANVNHQLEAEYDKIKTQFEKLIVDYQLNNFIYSSVDYNFLPIVGKTYYLYQRDNNTHFLSIIEPIHWKKKFLFAVYLDNSSKWNRIY